ncbi:hypothetical protein LCGC14_2909200, partial [marine sediment metagenome]
FLVRAWAQQIPVALLMTFIEKDMEHLEGLFMFPTVTELVIESTLKEALWANRPKGE